jgi:parallel beta-helix repeat protein
MIVLIASALVQAGFPRIPAGSLQPEIDPMTLTGWLERIGRRTSLSVRKRRARARGAASFRPRLETLEGRAIPTSTPGAAPAFTNLVQTTALLSGPALASERQELLLGQSLGLHTEVVHPNGSIQAAVDAAVPGTLILIEPGTYLQAVKVARPGITLAGLGPPGGARVIIANPGGEANGITVTARASDFALVNVAVQNFGVNGVFMKGTQGFVLSQVSAVDDGQYGLFPSFSGFGLIENCLASGNSDTGIYVGQSFNIQVVSNVTFANVNGIEVENSLTVQVIGNNTFDNAAGILVDLLPDLFVTTCSNILVQGNDVHDNNHANFSVPGDLASFVPPGTGILVLGADFTTVIGNVVTGNNFDGISVASTALLGLVSGVPVTGIEPNPDGTLIANNVVLGAPPALIPTKTDLFWDGSGVGNCWMGNVYATSLSFLPLPTC